VHRQHWLSWKGSLEQYGTQADWKRALSILDKAKNLNEQQLKTKELFEQMLDRWQKGVEDDDPHKFEDLLTES
jgi:hypothetical protein